MEAAKEYAFSDEIFEDVCIKFLSTNNNLALIRYLSLIYNLRMCNKQNDNAKNKFIDKYLVNTWLLELLFGKSENEVSKDILPNMRLLVRNEINYINLNLLYFILNIFGKKKELIELASLKQDYETIVLYLINNKEIDEAIKNINTYLMFGGENMNLLKKLFFKYAYLFINENPKETIQLLTDYFRTGYVDEDILKILNSPNYHILSGNSDSFKEIIEYVKKLKLKPIVDGDKELNLTKNQNLHNLYILLSAYSREETYKNELIEYLKKPIESYELKQKFKDSINISQDIYFDLYFAKKIFEKRSGEKDIKAYCLILFLLKQYTECIDIILNNNNLKDLLKLLPKNISDLKLQKKIWLQIFENKRKNGNLSDAKNIINESKGVIKLEDILPLMGDDVKINEFKSELKLCIEDYEKSVFELKKGIRNFNDANDLINKDIELSEKKAVRMAYTRLKCHRCGKNISGDRFFMFPCGHIFDVVCLIDNYKEFNKHNLGDGQFKNKVKVITDLDRKIRHLRDKKQKSLEEEQKIKEIENLGALQKLKTLNIKTLLTKDSNKVQFSDEEEFMLRDTQKILYNYLNEECLLCGKEMIKSTQIDFGDEDDIGWELI